MKQNWSVISRIHEYIGKLYYEKFLGNEFRELLDTNKFDEAINLLIESKVLIDQDIERVIIKHIETYKYAC